MKRTLVTIVLMAGIVMSAMAQISIGIRGGYSHTIFGGKDAKAWGFLNAEPTWKPGFHLGGSVFIHDYQPLILEGGLYFSCKGTR